MRNRPLYILITVILLLMVAAALSGCAGKQLFIDRPVEVKVPVPVACLDPRDIPAPVIYPVDDLTNADSDGDIIGALLAEHYQRASMEAVLRDMLMACTKGTL